MRNNETGEFELVVGNRQLLSGFFIVVLLFAVAFAMGYVVGQNSPRSTKGGETAAAAPPVYEPRPQPAASSLPSEAKPADRAGAAPSAESTAPPPQDASPQPITQPARQSEAAPVATNPNAPAVLAELPGSAGSFWQVTAVAQADAEVVAVALKKKGFPVFLSPGTKGLMRVMVGPYPDTAALGKAKTDLVAAGFPYPYRR